MWVTFSLPSPPCPAICFNVFGKTAITFQKLRNCPTFFSSLKGQWYNPHEILPPCSAMISPSNYPSKHNIGYSDYRVCSEYLWIEVHILKTRHQILIIFIGFSPISLSSGNKRITAVDVFIYRETCAPRPKCFKMLTFCNSLHSDCYLGDTAMFLILSFLLICPLSCKSASSSDSVLQNRKRKLLYEQLKVVKIWWM